MKILSKGMLTLGLSAGLLLAVASPAMAADRNHNRIPDSWEHKYHLSTVRNRANLDPDRDGLSNYNEYRSGTNPWVKDSDHDGTRDAREDRDHDELVNVAEVRARTNIRVADTDHDGVTDDMEDADRDGLDNEEEYRSGTNPRLSDSDHDGTGDAAEDADGDGVDNEDEFLEGTNPRRGDSDGDGIRDGDEIRGVIVSFDPESGTLVLASHRHDEPATATVTVDASTELAWTGDEAPATPPTLADLAAGARVRDVTTAPQPDGSLRAVRIGLKAEEADDEDEEADGEGDREDGTMASVVGYDPAAATLSLRPLRHEDAAGYTVLVTADTLFRWGEDVAYPGHEASAADLAVGRIVEVRYATGDGARTALRVVFHLIPETGEHEED